MKIEGFTENQILALVKTWKLGSPVDVLTFIGRADIPDEVKERVRDITASGAGVKAEAAAYLEMQAQIIIEVAELDKQRSNPMGPKEE
jgi:hypothetical protein